MFSPGWHSNTFSSYRVTYCCLVKRPLHISSHARYVYALSLRDMQQDLWRQRWCVQPLPLSSSSQCAVFYTDGNSFTVQVHLELCGSFSEVKGTFCPGLWCHGLWLDVGFRWAGNEKGLSWLEYIEIHDLHRIRPTELDDDYFLFLWHHQQVNYSTYSMYQLETLIVLYANSTAVY